MSSDVVIVGGGIVGLSTAYRLAKDGHTVTVVERGPVPNPLASSSDHHRLIRRTYGRMDGYTARMAEAFAAWRHLFQDLGPAGRYYAETGILNVSEEAGDGADLSRAGMDRLGVPYERIEGAEVARRFPFLDASNVAYATVSEGGALMANRILADLADLLRRRGVVVLEHAPVERVAAAAVHLADGRALSAGRVVVAAGVETRRLVPALAPRLTLRRSLILYADPPPDLAAAWAGAPSWNDLGGATDLWGMAPVMGLPAKLGNGDLGRDDPADTDRRIGASEIAAMIRSYRGRFRGIDRFVVRWGQANYWTRAPGEEFLLAEVDGVLAVSACSGHGFKFGPLSGADVAAAVTGSLPVETVAERMAGRLASAEMV
jgi:glycine/D-amino acid oxidase-like deaminating enzyme